ncbi:MFS transporter [Streptomyces virginiae]|uniref:MFS transporter n=1 Tax=Streptomyces TaxID=1883 RepID=UPI002E2C96E8|nr:MFS transporter [Streptomyces sp. NBC_00239]WSX96976.1 MFS transporter [Streptomyces goshikiensis]
MNDRNPAPARPATGSNAATDGPARGPADALTTPERRHRAVNWYLTGEAASLAGTGVHTVALPVIAMLYLQASPAQAAHLYLLSQIPYLIVSLPAGAIVDRYPVKTVLIATDLTAAALVAAIPAATASHTLTMSVLYTVALALGCVTVLHQAAASVVLVKLAAPALLQQATARQEAVLGAASTIGQYLGSGLLAVTTAARAIAADSLSYLISAWCTSRLPALPSHRAGARRTTLITEIRDGLRYTLGDPILRPLALCLGITGAGAGVVTAFSSWYLLTVIQVGPTGLGIIMGASGAGYLAGALLSPRLIHRAGPGKTLIVSVAVYPVLEVPLLMARPGGAWVAVLVVAGAVQLAAAACATATVRLVRLRLCLPKLQARTQQSATWMVAGSRPLAALAATVLAAAAGVWATLLAGTVVLAGSALALWLSPIRLLTHLPESSFPREEGGPVLQPPHGPAANRRSFSP